MIIDQHYFKMLLRHRDKNLAHTLLSDKMLQLKVYERKWFIFRRLVATYTYDLKETEEESTLHEYEDFVHEGISDNRYGLKSSLSYCMLGLTEELGELATHINKYITHDEPLDKTKVISEIGDLLWYLTAIVKLLSYNLLSVIFANTTKLNKRYKKGSGGRNYLIEKDIEQENTLIKKKMQYE